MSKTFVVLKKSTTKSEKEHVTEYMRKNEKKKI